MVRFIPSRAAAPRGPPTCPLDSRKARTMYCRSKVSRVPSLNRTSAVYFQIVRGLSTIVRTEHEMAASPFLVTLRCLAPLVRVRCPPIPDSEVPQRKKILSNRLLTVSLLELVPRARRHRCSGTTATCWRCSPTTVMRTHETTVMYRRSGSSVPGASRFVRKKSGR